MVPRATIAIAIAVHSIGRYPYCAYLVSIAYIKVTSRNRKYLKHWMDGIPTITNNYEHATNNVRTYYEQCTNSVRTCNEQCTRNMEYTLWSGQYLNRFPFNLVSNTRLCLTVRPYTGIMGVSRAYIRRHEELNISHSDWARVAYTRRTTYTQSILAFFITIKMPPRYSLLPSGSLFPVGDALQDLQPSLEDDTKTSYELLDNGYGVQIIAIQNDGGRSIYAPVPSHYAHLVRRFLWRLEVLKYLFRTPAAPSGARLSEDTLFAISSNLRYTIDVLRFCRPAFRDAARRDTPVRIPFFDGFILEEHFVGRHEPSAVIIWQRRHPGTNLRTANVLDLGEPCPSFLASNPLTTYSTRLDLSQETLWTCMGWGGLQMESTHYSQHAGSR